MSSREYYKCMSEVYWSNAITFALFAGLIYENYGGAGPNVWVLAAMSIAEIVRAIACNRRAK